MGWIELDKKNRVLLVKILNPFDDKLVYSMAAISAIIVALPIFCSSVIRVMQYLVFFIHYHLDF